MTGALFFILRVVWREQYLPRVEPFLWVSVMSYQEVVVGDMHDGIVHIARKIAHKEIEENEDW